MDKHRELYRYIFTFRDCIVCVSKTNVKVKKYILFIPVLVYEKTCSVYIPLSIRNLAVEFLFNLEKSKINMNTDK